MDSQLKQRLIGAAVLIALAIIFVPMFLSGAPPRQDTATLNLDIPPPPEREFQTRVVPAGSAQPAIAPPPAPISSDHVATVDVANVPPPAEPPLKPAEVAIAQPMPSPPAPAKPAAAKPEPAKPELVATPAPANGRFAVHLGVYGNVANASALVTAARKLGLPVYTDTAEADGKPATRVRLGPFVDRVAAEAARLKFKQAESKVPSSIVESTAGAEPVADIPATALAPNRAGGWAVQIGAFKVQEEANKLRDRAKNAGFAAFVEPIGQGADKLWRVRVGPQADRSNAEKLRNQLKQKLALNGTIVTQS